MVAQGEKLDDSEEFLYYLISVYLDNSADERTTSALMKLSPESSPVSIAELSPEFVSSVLPPYVPPPQVGEIVRQREKKFDSYGGGGFVIRFKEGQLFFVGICSHCNNGREYPIVGRPDGKNLYTLPLTIEQITAVFGPSDKMRKTGEVYYGR